jgi:hypothetical protein
MKKLILLLAFLACMFDQTKGQVVITIPTPAVWVNGYNVAPNMQYIAPRGYGCRPRNNYRRPRCNNYYYYNDNSYYSNRGRHRIRYYNNFYGNCR